jgi:hypothetical protein
MKEPDLERAEDRSRLGEGRRRQHHSERSGFAVGTDHRIRRRCAIADDHLYRAIGRHAQRHRKKFLGNANDYMDIFNANRDQLTDPDKIKPGQVLKIPQHSRT